MKKEITTSEMSAREIELTLNCESFEHNFLIRMLFVGDGKRRCPFVNILCAVDPVRDSRQL